MGNCCVVKVETKQLGLSVEVMAKAGGGPQLAGIRPLLARREGP